MLLADLTPAVIAEARDVLLLEVTTRQKLRNPATVNRYLAAFSRGLTIAMKEWGWIDAPARYSKAAKATDPRHRENGRCLGFKKGYSIEKERVFKFRRGDFL